MSYTGTLAASFCRSDALFKKKGISGCTFKQTSCGNTLKNYQFLFVDTKIPIIRYLSSMVMASARWLGVRLDVVASLIVGSVAAAAVFVAQDAGKY